MPNPPKGAIVGLGVTPMGKIYGRRSVDFAAEAIALAIAVLLLEVLVALVAGDHDGGPD